jgi:nitrogen fixation-related uncharacterized protein
MENFWITYAPILLVVLSLIVVFVWGGKASQFPDEDN